MVAPITGPFSDTLSVGVGIGSRYWTRQIYRQQKPYDLPLQYSRTDRGVGSDVGWGTLKSSTNTQKANVYGNRSPKRWEDIPSGVFAQSSNKARERLMSKLQDGQLLLATLAEAKQTIGMMTNRFIQARNIVLAVRHRDIPRLKDALTDATGGRGPRTLPKFGKTFGDAILEVYFGIKPILSDLQNGAEILSKDFDFIQIDGNGKATGDQFTSSNAEITWFRKQEEYWVKTKCGCRAKVSNPNEFLAEKLGLVNPFATAWELVPWSFVVDYFVNVNQFVGALTDTYGVTLRDPWTRTRTFSFASYESRNFNSATHKLDGGYTTGIWCRETRAVTSLPNVRLSSRAFSLGKDLSRLVTSGALLLQALGK